MKRFLFAVITLMACDAAVARCPDFTVMTVSATETAPHVMSCGTSSFARNNCDNTKILHLPVFPIGDTCQKAFIHLDTVLSSHIPHPESDSAGHLYYYIDLCPYDTLHLVAYGEYPDNDISYHQSDTTSDFLWNFGTQTFTGTNLTAVDFNFESAQGYDASVTMTDSMGCPAQEPYVFRIRVSQNPIQGLAPIPDICIGQSFEFTTGYDSLSVVCLEPVGSERVTTLAVPDTAFLPDGIDCGDGCSYTSPVTFTSFAPNATIQSTNDILYVRLSLEHSYVGDLWISLTCPNGKSVSLMKKLEEGDDSGCANLIPDSAKGWFPNPTIPLGKPGRAYFGVPNHTDGNNPCEQSDNPPGTCWNYLWSDNTNENFHYNTGKVYSNSNRHTYVTEPLGQRYYYLDSSNVAEKRNMFHPDDNMNKLIGCPLNGDWSIEVLDGYNEDNGYLCGWELALDPLLLPQDWHYQIAVDTAYVSGRGSVRLTVTPDTVGDLQYTVHVMDEYGCMYDVDTVLRVNPNTDTTLYDTIVENELPYTWYDITFTGADTQTFTIPNFYGCDSNITLILHVWPNVTAQADSTICETELPLLWNEVTFTTADTKTATLTAHTGADSILTMRLFVNPILRSDTFASICDNHLPFVWYEHSYDATGDYTRTFQSTVTGCDSIITLHLTVISATTVDIDARACDTYDWNGIIYTISGNYVQQFTDMAGCDSIVTLYLTISKPEAHISVSPIADYYPTNRDISFMDCSISAINWHWDLGNFYTTNERNFQYAYTETGIYTVTLIVSDDFGCLDSAIQEIKIYEEMHLYIPNCFTPNGDGINDVFLPKGMGVSTEGYTLSIFNRWGEMIFSTHDLNQGWDGTYRGRYVESGTIFNYVIHYQNREKRKFVKTGIITVL